MPFGSIPSGKSITLESLRDYMQVGIVGKPNVGKSTLFGAATMAPVEIANYPFTTIEPNKGVAYVRTPCPCKELGIQCTPHNSMCVSGTRMVPIELLDVAGLVPDAWDGKGLGNKFLDDLRQADAFINVVDASGSTDIEGNPGEPGRFDPTGDVTFLRKEISLWMREVIKNGLGKIARQAKMQGSKPETIIHERIAGLNVTEGQVKEALRKVPMPQDPTLWNDDELYLLCEEIRKLSKPMIIAMNKADISSKENLEKLGKMGDRAVPTLAETELALKKAATAGLIDYMPGDIKFNVKSGVTLNEGQKKALDYMAAKISEHNGTGVQKCIEDCVFGLLDLISVYPVEDETKFTDHFGRVLPDCFLMPRGSTAKDLAYKVHTDLGDKFIRAVNAKTKRTVGSDYILQDGDIIRIVANK
jgi:Predicted GTPase, probable translation factor